MHVKIEKNNVHLHAVVLNKLFHVGRYIGRLIGQYFKLSTIFCCKRYDERFSHIVSATGKKGDIRRYLGRIGRYLKQEKI